MLDRVHITVTFVDLAPRLNAVVAEYPWLFSCSTLVWIREWDIEDLREVDFSPFRRASCDASGRLWRCLERRFRSPDGRFLGAF
jgi:hypothetical protein